MLPVKSSHNEQNRIELPAKLGPKPQLELAAHALTNTPHRVAEMGEVDEQRVFMPCIKFRGQALQQRRLDGRAAVHPRVAFDQKAVFEVIGNELAGVDQLIEVH